MIRLRYEPGETPVDAVFGKMQLQAVPFVIRQVEPFRRQQLRPRHAVCRLGAEQPVQACRLVVQDVKLHLAARTRDERDRFPRRHRLQHRRDRTVLVLHRLRDVGKPGSSRMRPHPQMEGAPLRIVKIMVRVGKLHHVRLQPADTDGGPSRSDARYRSRLDFVKGDSETVQRIFIDSISETELRSEGPALSPGQIAAC
ncbi:MAG: hypothetical protein K0Q94_4131, partial [Paenibacillus sp.]|nr:hypothetical protein [Paenibacillus sp.]